MTRHSMTFFGYTLGENELDSIEPALLRQAFKLGTPKKGAVGLEASCYGRNTMIV